MKKSLSRLISMALALVLVCGCFAMAGTVRAADMPLPFTDVPEESWYHDYVEEMYEDGIMVGVNDTTFNPYGETTRAMLVSVLYRLEGRPEVGENKFVDVPADAYYADAVTWARENRVVFGIDDTHFAPNRGISRQQFMTLLYRYAIYKGVDLEPSFEILEDFKDYADVSKYAFLAMAWAVEQDLIEGVEEEILAPQATATRAQTAAFLSRFLDELVDD